MASAQTKLALYQATVARDLARIHEMILISELRGISGRLESLHQAVEDNQLEIVQALVSDRPFTKREEGNDGQDDLLGPGLCNTILTKSLRKSDPGYWIAVRRYVIHTLTMADLGSCSIQMLRYFQEHDQITNVG